MISILYYNELTFLAKLGRERRESPNSVPLKEQRSIHVPEYRYEISIIARLRIYFEMFTRSKRERWRGLFCAVNCPSAVR